MRNAAVLQTAALPLGVPRLAEGKGIEPPGAVPRRLSKPFARPDGLPSKSDMHASEAEGEGVEPPDPVGSTAFKAAWRAHAEPSGGR